MFEIGISWTWVTGIQTPSLPRPLTLLTPSPLPLTPPPPTMGPHYVLSSSSLIVYCFCLLFRLARDLGKHSTLGNTMFQAEQKVGSCTCVMLDNELGIRVNKTVKTLKSDTHTCIIM